MSIPQTTPLSLLLEKEEPQISNPTGQFANLPGRVDNRPITNVQPTGVGQGLSAPEGLKRNEFFGVQCGYKDALLAIALIMILASPLMVPGMRFVPGLVSSDGSRTIMGYVFLVIIAVVLFFVIK